MVPARPASPRCRWPEPVARRARLPVGRERRCWWLGSGTHWARRPPRPSTPAANVMTAIPIVCSACWPSPAGHCVQSPSGRPGDHPYREWIVLGVAILVWEIVVYTAPRESGRPSDLQLDGRRGRPVTTCSRRCCSSHGSACAPSSCVRAGRPGGPMTSQTASTSVGAARGCALGLWALSRRAGSAWPVRPPSCAGWPPVRSHAIVLVLVVMFAGWHFFAR